MVIVKYRDKSGNEVEAVQFVRTVWKTIRRFTNNQVVSMRVPGCSNELATCELRVTPQQFVPITESDWIVKDEGGYIRVYSAKDFNQSHKN